MVDVSQSYRGPTLTSIQFGSTDVVSREQVPFLYLESQGRLSLFLPGTCRGREDLKPVGDRGRRSCPGRRSPKGGIVMARLSTKSGGRHDLHASRQGKPTSTSIHHTTTPIQLWVNTKGVS